MLLVLNAGLFARMSEENREPVTSRIQVLHVVALTSSEKQRNITLH